MLYTIRIEIKDVIRSNEFENNTITFLGKILASSDGNSGKDVTYTKNKIHKTYTNGQNIVYLERGTFIELKNVSEEVYKNYCKYEEHLNRRITIIVARKVEKMDLKDTIRKYNKLYELAYDCNLNDSKLTDEYIKECYSIARKSDYYKDVITVLTQNIVDSETVQILVEDDLKKFGFQQITVMLKQIKCTDCKYYKLNKLNNISNLTTKDILNVIKNIINMLENK